jgi:hypothetical protein
LSCFRQHRNLGLDDCGQFYGAHSGRRPDPHETILFLYEVKIGQIADVNNVTWRNQVFAH